MPTSGPKEDQKTEAATDPSRRRRWAQAQEGEVGSPIDSSPSRRMPRGGAAAAAKGDKAAPGLVLVEELVLAAAAIVPEAQPKGEALLEDRPKLRPRRELLKPADLEVADDIVADLIEEELSVPDFMLAIAAATVGITVALIQRESYAPEDAASRALAVAELAINDWVKHFRQRLVLNSW
jgi:hypothetical protein